MNHTKVEYIYHQHTGNPSVAGGCYGTISAAEQCPGILTIYNTTTGSAYFGDAKCSVCGYTKRFITGLNEAVSNPYHKSQSMGRCFNTISTSSIVLICGKTESTIESAKVVIN